MTREDFEELVREGIGEIPEEFREKLDNVAVVVSDEPSPEQRGQLRLRKGHTLFGLYEGVPQTARGSGYSLVLPDKITIFQRPMEESARDEEDLKEMVRNTVWHEIAHHFGMDESEVEAAEERRSAR